MTKVQSKNAILFDIENDAGPLRDAMVETIGEGSTVDPGLISAIDKAKLDGIAAGATVNASDTALRDRATHTGEQAIGTITGLVDALAGKATPADVASALAGLVDSSPATLDTLNELAAALGDDPDFATTVSTALGNRLRVDAAQGLSAPQQAQGRDNLGLGTAALENTEAFATAEQGALADTALQPEDLAVVSLESFGAVADKPTIDNTAAINAAFQASKTYGTRIHGGPHVYHHAGTLVIPAFAQFEGVIGKTEFFLSDGSDVTQMETEDFDVYDAANAVDVANYPDLTIGFSFKNFILNGNKANQSPAGLIYGARLYGRRFVWDNVQIANTAGIGLWTKHPNTNGIDFDYTDTRGSSVNNLNITESFYEQWVFEGPADIPVGSVHTNNSGDSDAVTAQTSLKYSGEPIYGLRIEDAFTCDEMNINGVRFGQCVYVNNRIKCGTAIASGGWGNFLFTANAWGSVDNLLSQANPYDWGGVVKPHIETLTDDVQFGSTTIRRQSGADQPTAPGIKDSGGCQWGMVRNRQALSQGGTVFYADATGINIGSLDVRGADIALHTTALCSELTVSCHFNNVATVWKNEKTGLFGSFKFRGTLNAGQLFEDATFSVSTGTYKINIEALSRADISFLDNGTRKNNSFRGAVAVDASSTGAKTGTFTHSLWRTPVSEEITLSLRHNGFTAPAVMRAYHSGFSSTTVSYRVDVDTAATGSPTTQVICKIG